MITKEGIVIIVMTIFFFIVAINVQAGLLYIFISILLSILIINMFFPYLSLNGIEVTRSGADCCHEDEFSDVNLRVKNTKKQTRYLFNIEDTLTCEGKKRQTFFVNSIKPGEELQFNYKLMGFKRGIYTLASPSLTCRAPFGIFQCKKHFKEKDKGKLVVFPKIYKITEAHFNGGGNPKMLYQTSASKSGHSENFWGLREYKPGDSLRFVHWRSTAKLNMPMVKEFEMPSFSPVAILIDCNRMVHRGTGKDTTLEYSLRFAATLCVYLHKKNIAFELIAFDSEEKISSSPSIQKNLTWMSGIKGEGKTSLKEAMEKVYTIVSRGTNLIIFTPDMSLNENILKKISKKMSSIQILFLEPSSFCKEEKSRTQLPVTSPGMNIKVYCYTKDDKPEGVMEKLLRR